MLVIDIEATGTNAHVHSILSIGAVDFSKPDRRFYGECRRFDGAHIMEGALEVNGFTLAQIDDARKMSETELLKQFLAWSLEVSDRTFAGQNVSFDRSYIEAACARAGVLFDFPYRTLDTHTMCYMHMVRRGITPPHDSEHKRTDISLNTALQYCGVPKEPDPHNALMGALCHSEVASRLLYGRNLLPEFLQYPVPW